MIRLMSVAVLTLALSLAGCGSSTSEAPKAGEASKPTATGCKSCNKAGTAACPATGSGETKTPATEKK